jgi:hypothetical protein
VVCYVPNIKNGHLVSHEPFRVFWVNQDTKTLANNGGEVKEELTWLESKTAYGCTVLPIRDSGVVQVTIAAHPSLPITVLTNTSSPGVTCMVGEEELLGIHVATNGRFFTSVSHVILYTMKRNGAVRSRIIRN